MAIHCHVEEISHVLPVGPILLCVSSLLVDHIEANVEVAGTRVEQGNKQLVKAVRHKVCSCVCVCAHVCMLCV